MLGISVLATHYVGDGTDEEKTEVSRPTLRRYFVLKVKFCRSVLIRGPLATQRIEWLFLRESPGVAVVAGEIFVDSIYMEETVPFGI